MMGIEDGQRHVPVHAEVVLAQRRTSPNRLVRLSMRGRANAQPSPAG